jgi:catechol 2,3-dioxygenase-like lactoylglutathione lyase family enzyme
MLLDGVNHIGLVTDDIDRFVEFYREVFDATVSGVEHTPFGTLTFVDIGPRTELNVFHLNDSEKPDVTRGSMFTHGPIDHIGLQAKSKEAFDEIRRRMMARGATDGFVTDFGHALSLFFRDPDGLEGEVLLWVRSDGPGNPPGTSAAGYEVGVP